MGIPPQNDDIAWWNRKYWCSAINWEPPIRKVWMILLILFNRDDTVDGQNLVRLGNGAEDSANNQVHQIYLLDSICWKSHHCCLTNFGFLSYHVLSEGVLLSEIFSEHCLMVDFQKYFIRDWSWYLPHVAKRRGSLGLDREWRDWVTGSQREKNAKLAGTFSPHNFVAI